MKTGTCYVCDKEKLVEEHHLIPQSRGGKEGPQVKLCTECHDKGHYLAISKRPLEEIVNPRLRKIVKIIRIANAVREHSETIKVTIEIPKLLHKRIKESTGKGKGRSIQKTILTILVKHFTK